MEKYCKRKKFYKALESTNWIPSCVKDWIKHNTFLIGIVSLIWLIWRTGSKPSRITYPCQKTASANVLLFLVLPFALFLHKFRRHIYKFLTKKQWIPFTVIAGISLMIISTTVLSISVYQHYKTKAYYQSISKGGPIGKIIIPGTIAGSTTLLTTPHAMAINSPHRVVSVHSTDATSWSFSCPDLGPCSDYYGDDSNVNQAVVNEMLESGMKRLTGTSSLQASWNEILPNYQSGETIAVKVNFNDSTWGGGGISGYGDNDSYVDALPQVANAMIKGLKTIGVAEKDILIYDASRYITDRFRDRINYSGISYFDSSGNGSDVKKTYFTKSVNFSASGYSGSHEFCDVLVNADYVINMPIMKKHGAAGITLSSKNHLGSINRISNMHDYIYPDESHYSSNVNPLVDMNKNSYIEDKTVLIIGDALYGTRRGNNEPPKRWQSFGDDSPNMLFVGVDPVAIDSVMFDYLEREKSAKSGSEDVLIVAANAGLGVHERWNNDNDREYTGGLNGIDYIEIELGEVSEIRADVNQDSSINTTDAMLTLRNSLGLDMSGTAWKSSATTGDVNCDSVSNSTDAMLILRYSLGLNMSGTRWCE